MNLKKKFYFSTHVAFLHFFYKEECSGGTVDWPFMLCTLMPGPCSGEKLISILVTDYIHKRRGQALLLCFEYNLLPNLILNFNQYMDINVM